VTADELTPRRHLGEARQEERSKAGVQRWRGPNNQMINPGAAVVPHKRARS
jgi:hypothetical protein